MQIHVNKNALQKMIFGWITLHLKIFYFLCFILSFIFDHKQITGDTQGWRTLFWILQINKYQDLQDMSK